MRTACVALAFLLASCGSDPLDEISIAAVRLQTAPRLEFLRARKGMRFFAVKFEFENRSGETLRLRALDFALRDTQGKLYPYSAQVLDMGQPKGDAEATLESGRRPGSVVFQIPKGVTPAALVYKPDVDGGLSISLFES